MLSKSKYCSFVQCPKNLRLGMNKPELASYFTDLSEHLLKIRENIRDLLVPFRK